MASETSNTAPLRRDPQIGALDQHKAAAHREAVDRGDDRLFQRARHERVLDRRAARRRGCRAASDSFMSSPAQKPRPVPVKIATSKRSLWRNSVQVSASAVRISWLSALSRSGRFIRTTRICPCSSVSTTAISLSQMPWLARELRGGEAKHSRRAPRETPAAARRADRRSDSDERRAMPASVGELLGLAAAILAAGIVTGLLAGLFGIGGGAVIVPVLYEVFRLVGVPEEVRMQLCIGTSLAIIVPTSCAPTGRTAPAAGAAGGAARLDRAGRSPASRSGRWLAAVRAAGPVQGGVRGDRRADRRQAAVRTRELGRSAATCRAGRR